MRRLLFLVFLLLASPASAQFVTNPGNNAAKVLDVFLVIGDSNARGHGVSPGLFPTPATGSVIAYCANGTVQNPAADPVCSASNASMNTIGSDWPTFGIGYYSATGRSVGLVITAQDGSTQSSACDQLIGNGNWDASGSLYPAAIAALGTAMTKFRAAGYYPKVRGVIMSLGGNDAATIDATTCTVGQFQSSSLAMYARLRAEPLLWPQVPIYAIQAGTNLNVIAPDSPGYVQVRAMQETISAADMLTPLVSINAFDFLARGLMQAGGGHYVQTGYNEIGAAIVANVLSWQSKLSGQRNGNDLYWSKGSFTVGYPVASAPLGVNQTAAALPAPLAGTMLHLAAAVGTATRGELDSYGVNPQIALRYANGTPTVPTRVLTGNNIGSFAMFGYGLTTYSSSSAAGVSAIASEDWTDSAHGAYTSLYSTTPGGTTLTEVLRADARGVQIGAPTGGAKGAGTFNSAGAIYVNNSLALVAASNLSDVANAATARSNLGLAAVASSGSASDLTTGTLPAAQLPSPTASTLGGVKSLAAVSHQFLTSISTGGLPAAAQPAASDVSGLAAVATSGSATDLTAGTLPCGRLPALTGDVTTSGCASTLVAGSSNENRLCNGDMLIDQRLAGGATTPTATAQLIDCWKALLTQASKITFQQSATAQGPFPNSLKMLTASTFTPGAADAFLTAQFIEGLNVADLGWGTASAQGVMLTFRAQASVTGNYSLALVNGAGNRSYVVTYNVAVANTPAYYTVTVPGDTSGTWVTTNAVALQIKFDLGVGSNFQTSTTGSWQAGNFAEATGAVQLVTNAAATLYITNVRLRVGTRDVAYAARPYETELGIARRYFRSSFPAGTAPAQNAGVAGSRCVKNPIALGDPSLYEQFVPPMRATPTITTYNPSVTNANWRDVTASSDSTVSVDPATAIGNSGVLLATSGTVATLGDVLCIHYAADAAL